MASTMTARMIFAAVLLAFVGAQATLAPQADGAERKARTRPAADHEYLIGPEDVLEISVWNNKAVSRIVTVRPDGMISLPLVNDVKAAGLTPMEFRDLLAQKLTDYVASPSVSVIVNDVRSFKVSVLGEVVRQDRYELKSPTTILDVIALAGGFNQFAAPAQIIIFRRDVDTQRRARVRFNYNRVVQGRDDEILYLQPGDIILVP
jgi:polysaccharide export outer membrane protein